jgi:hypothetical protein
MSASNLVEEAGSARMPARAPSARGASAGGSDASTSAAATVVRAPGPRRRRRGTLVAVALVLVAAAIVAAIAAGGGGTSPPTPPDAAVAPAPTPPDRDLADLAVARANELIDAGQKAAALDHALSARKRHPDDARLAFLAGKLYFDKYYWTDGMKLLREAIRLDPRYRTDRELIRTVLRGFIVTPRADAALAAFLREDIGPEARPYLEETAADHPNPIIRARAADELRRYPQARAGPD